jgi:hypothetical protein
LLEYTNAQTAAREQRGGKEPRGRTTNNGHALSSRRASRPLVLA